MRGRALIAVTLVVLVSLAVGSAEARSPVLLPACSVLNLEYKPAEWSPGCTGGSPLLRKLEWRGWGTSRAEASGRVLLNDCEPSCAEGATYRYPARIAAYRIRSCQDGGRRHRQYTRVVLRWKLPPDNPFGEPAGWDTFGPIRVKSADCRAGGGRRVAGFSAGGHGFLDYEELSA